MTDEQTEKIRKQAVYIISELLGAEFSRADRSDDVLKAEKTGNIEGLYTSELRAILWLQMNARENDFLSALTSDIVDALRDKIDPVLIFPQHLKEHL
jgi:hypothetical protein